MYGGLVGGVKAWLENMFGGRPMPVCTGLTCDCGPMFPPKRAMSSNGESPLMLNPSRFSVGGEPQLDIESLDEAEEAYWP